MFPRRLHIPAIFLLVVSAHVGVARSQESAAPTLSTTEETAFEQERSRLQEELEREKIEVDTSVEISEGEDEDWRPYDDEEKMKARFGSSWDWGRRDTERLGIGQSIHITHDLAVTRAVSVWGGVTVDGYVDEKVVAVGGNIVIGPDAIVRGDLVAPLYGRIQIKSGAFVGGDVVSALGGTVEIEDGAVVRGDRVNIALPGSAWIAPISTNLEAHNLESRKLFFVLFFRVLGFVKDLILSYLVILLAPKAIGTIRGQLERNPLISELAGWGGLLGAVVISTILILTCIGILLIPFVFLLYWILLVVGMTAIYLFIGGWIRLRFRSNGYRPYLNVILGVVVITLLSLIPALGFLLEWLLAFAGAGAVILTRFGTQSGVGELSVKGFWTRIRQVNKKR